VLEGQGDQFMGESNDHMKVVGGEQPFHPTLKPLGLGETLAFGAVAIAAGVVGDAEVSAQRKSLSGSRDYYHSKSAQNGRTAQPLTTGSTR
jgi:hypothetical protein